MRRDQPQTTPLWRSWEQRLLSECQYDDPVQEVGITVTFESPSGVRHHVDGFWDGGTTWRVRGAAPSPDWRSSTASRTPGVRGNGSRAIRPACATCCSCATSSPASFHSTAMSHCCGQTPEGLCRMGEITGENVLRVLRGEEPLYRVA